MTSYIIGRSVRGSATVSQISKVIPDLSAMTPDEVIANRRSAWFVGTPEEIAQQMREHASLGVDLFMLRTSCSTTLTR